MMSDDRAAPTILSLDDLQIELAQDIRKVLTSQYLALHDNDEDKASAHLNRILEAMKRPLATSVCRINQILVTDKEALKLELLRHLQKWQQERGAAPVVAMDDELFPDVLQVRVDSNRNDESLRSCTRPRATQQSSIFASWSKRQELGWPMTHRVLICDRFAGEAVLRGSDIFVRGIICSDSSIQVGDQVAVYADIPDAKKCKTTRGTALQDYTGKCVFIGFGTAKCTRTDMFRLATGVGIEMSARAAERAGPVLPPLHGVLSKEMMLQNLPSVAVAHALDPQPRDVILDMCCAPGGKTSHVASLVRNKATIVACDKSRKKLGMARALFARMGATCITPLALNSTNCVIRNGESHKSVQQLLDEASASEKDGLLNVKAFYAECFDRILLDPPCSALGLRPKLLVDLSSANELTKSANYQRQFVKEAVALLKPGGTLTYSTCTINSMENEEMVAHILKNYNMELASIDFAFGQPGLPGRGLNDEQRRHVRHFDPSDDSLGTMGFFIAKLVKGPKTTWY